MSQKNGGNVFNGQAVRLDNIKSGDGTTILEISMIDFFDFLSTTMVYLERDSLIMFCDDHHMKKEKALIDNYCSSIDGVEVDSSFETIVNDRRVSNIIAVSILIEDKNGYVGIIQRSNKVAVFPRMFGVPVTGVLDDQDFHKKDPFLSCVKRELKEELNLTVETDSIIFDELVMSKQKLQPIALYSLTLNHSWKELFPTIKTADDFHNEIEEMYAVPVSMLPDFVTTETFTEAAAYQLYRKVSQCGLDNSLANQQNDDFNKRSFLL